MRIAHDIKTCRDRHNANVVMRASAHAIETERAVEVAGLAREIKIHFATALSRVSAQTIMSLATGANARLAHFDFER